MHKIKPSTELNSTIISLYTSGLDTYQVAEKCGCSQTFIMNALKRSGIQRRTTQSYTRKYIPNENFFNVIDTQEKAYVLGLLYADGNNYVKGVHSYEVSCKLLLSDKAILERMRDLLSPQSPIKKVFDKNTNDFYWLLKIHSKKLTQQLTKLGCVPAKSLILIWPKWLVDPELQRHFIRGYFDGDGSLYAKKPTNTGHIDWGWQITSTRQFCLAVKKILETKLNIHCSIVLSKPKTNQITTVLSVGGNLQVKKVLDWLYQDANIYLPRKYDKYMEFINGAET
jgi:hypothetical protein